MNILVLDTTTKTIKAVLAGAVTTTQPTFVSHYADATSTSFTEGSSNGALNSATPVTLVSAPAASTRRLVKEISIYNGDVSPVVLTLSLDNNGTDRVILKKTISSGCTFFFGDKVVKSVGNADFKTDQAGGNGDTYGVLSGTRDGTNALFTVSEGVYISGSLLVYMNGQLSTQGITEDWVETTPSSGTFTFNTPPSSLDEITAIYKKAGVVTTNADTLDGFHASYFPTATAYNAHVADFTKHSGIIGAHGKGATIPTITTYYFTPFIDGLQSVAYTCSWPQAGTLSKMYVSTSTGQSATGSLVFTLVVNGADTTLVVTIPAGSAAGTFSNLVNTVTIAAGDRLRWKILNNATVASANIFSCVMAIS